MQQLSRIFGASITPNPAARKRSPEIKVRDA
jgi:hypothetical protein